MKMNKKLLTLLLSLIIILSSTSGAFACTGIYVGNQLSQNGSTYVGRSEDIGDLYGKLFTAVPAKDWPEGSIYKDSYGFSMPYPSHTYAYNCVRDSYSYGEGMTDENGNNYGEPYGAAGVNENGVSISATVSTAYNAEAEAADPLLDTGICEISIASVVLGSASTAREGVEILAGILDTYGSGECNAIVISDANESYYMEIVSGHQYAAVKLPADKITVNPNIMLLGEIDVDDTENVIVSKGLLKTAEDNNFYRTGENGKFHVAKSYAEQNSGKGQYSRYYQGVYYVNPEEADTIDVNGVNNNVNPLPFYIDAAKQLSTLDVLHYLAYRGEGSKMDSNQNPSIYPIGNTRQAECHVFEMRPEMPSALSTIEWLSMADAEFSIYLPYYGTLVNDTHESYQVEGNSFTDNSINWNFQKINYLCNQNRDKYGKNVKAYFEKWQNRIIEQQKSIDAEMATIYATNPALAQEKANELGKSLASQTLTMTTSVLVELQNYIDNGDYTEAFVPTMMTNDVMPDYSFDLIGGTGLDDKNDNQTDNGQTDNGNNNSTDSTVKPDSSNNYQTANTTAPSIEKAPKTGDNTSLSILLIVLVLSLGVLLVGYKKYHSVK